MTYTLVIIKIGSREERASEVQKLLTEFGCNIKVRLGLHDLPENSCSSAGLIILEVTGEESEIDDFVEKLNAFGEVTAKKMVI